MCTPKEIKVDNFVPQSSKCVHLIRLAGGEAVDHLAKGSAVLVLCHECGNDLILRQLVLSHLYGS